MRLLQKIKDFKAQRRAKAIEGNLKTLQNPKAIREDRVAALEFFCSYPEATVAVPALLQRFGFSLDHGIYDAREKESAFEGILKQGKAAIEIVRAHLQETHFIAWPLKILGKLASETEMREILENCLDYGDIALDADKTDKNYDILCHVRDFTLEAPHKKMGPFLEAHDERIRYAAVEVLLRQPHTPEIGRLLERFIPDFSAENTRLHQVILDAYLAEKWKVAEPERLVNAGLPAGIYLTPEGTLSARA